MQLEVGTVLEGKVTGITKFGAFVSLPDGKSGLVHISEIANTFVNDVHDYVKDGDTVKVKVIGLGDDGKINLSIKKAVEPQERPAPAPRSNSGFRPSAPRPAQPFARPAQPYGRQNPQQVSGPTRYSRPWGAASARRSTARMRATSSIIPKGLGK